MKTQNTKLTQTVKVWAVPRSSYAMEQNPNSPPFEFRIRTDSPWENGAVNVFEKEITIEVPDGIDLTERAIATLREAKLAVLADAERRIVEIDTQISNLTLIEHKPNGD